MRDNPEQTPATKQARYEGQRAFLRGVQFKENPHPLNTNVCRAWSRGWDEKSAEARRVQRPHCLAINACAAKGDGHCRQCWGKRLKALSAANPEVEARRRAGRSEAMRAHNLAVAATPEGRKMLADRARKHAVLLRPEVQAKAHTPDRIAARVVKMRAARNALPAERRREISSIGGRANAAKDAPRKARLAAQIARFAIERQEREQRERREREKAQAY